MEFTKLGSIFPDFPIITEAIELSRSRVLRKARWMTKLLYTIKINLSSWDINTGTF